MTKLAIDYIGVALNLLELNREQLQKEIDEYIHVDTASRKSLDRYFQLKDEGFDLGKKTTKLVDFDIAIRDLKNHIWLLKRQNA